MIGCDQTSNCRVGNKSDAPLAEQRLVKVHGHKVQLEEELRTVGVQVDGHTHAVRLLLVQGPHELELGHQRLDAVGQPDLVGRLAENADRLQA
jgi:hypothetical protein